MKNNKVKDIEFRIGPCSQGNSVWIIARREDVYPNGAYLDLNNGDSYEGTCAIYLSTEQMRDVGLRIIEAADAIEAERSRDDGQGARE